PAGQTRGNVRVNDCPVSGINSDVMPTTAQANLRAVDVTFSPSTVCRPSVGVCDATEVCTNASPACPADVVSPPGTVCRASTGALCRVSAVPGGLADTCSGTSAACVDGFKPPRTVGLAGTGACDPPDTCTGSTPGCPVKDPTGFPCDDGNVCTVDSCNAAG